MDLRNFKPTGGMENGKVLPKSQSSPRRKYSNIVSVYFTKSDPILSRAYEALLAKYPPTRKGSVSPNVTQYIKEHAEEIIANCAK